MHISQEYPVNLLAIVLQTTMHEECVLYNPIEPYEFPVASVYACGTCAMKVT